jgi:hypothetical protein
MLFLICAKLFGCQPFSRFELDCLHWTSLLICLKMDKKAGRIPPKPFSVVAQSFAGDGFWHGAVYGQCLVFTPNTPSAAQINCTYCDAAYNASFKAAA